MEETKSTSLVAFSKTEAALAGLREKYKRPFPVSTTKEITEAKEARAELREYRTDVEKVRKAEKAPLLERGKLIDAEAARLTAELEALEAPIDLAIKTEEARKEAAKKAEEEKAAEAQRAALALSEKFRAALAWAYGKPSGDIAKCIEGLNAQQVTPDEHKDNVETVRSQVREQLQNLQAQAEKREADDREREAERAELARLREAAAKEEARRKAELEAEEAKARQAREAADAEAAAARRKADDEAARARAEQDRVAREAREKEEARVRAERAKVEEERAALAAKEMVTNGGRNMLQLFVEKYGHAEEFKTIAVTIEKWLNPKKAVKVAKTEAAQ